MREIDVNDLRGLGQLPIAALSPSRALRRAKWAIALFALPLAAAACLLFVKIDESSRVRGVVRPRGEVIAVQASMAGMLSEVLFSEGDRVDIGTVVMRYDVEQLRIRHAGVQAQIKRLDETLAQLEAKRRSQLTANQREQEVGRINIQIAELEIAATNNELKKEAAEARDERIKALKELEHLKRTLATLQNLYKTDVISRAQLDESEFRVQQAEINYAAALRRENGTGNRVDVAAAKMAREVKSAEASRQGNTKYLEELDLEIVSARQTLGQARQEEESVQSLLNASVVRAPLTGVIVNMPVRHAGRIVSPGDDLFSLMPSDAELLVELQVPDDLIGQVRTGQSTRYRFASFPYVEYGTAEGKIIKIASDSTSSDGQSFYRAWASLSSTQLRASDNRTGQIRIGMLVDAEIVIDRSSIAARLLKILNL